MGSRGWETLSSKSGEQRKCSDLANTIYISSMWRATALQCRPSLSHHCTDLATQLSPPPAPQPPHHTNKDQAPNQAREGSISETRVGVLIWGILPCLKSAAHLHTQRVVVIRCMIWYDDMIYVMIRCVICYMLWHDVYVIWYDICYDTMYTI